jgi:peptidylprolyl isomerase
MNRALRRGAPIALASVTLLLLAGCAGGGETPEPSATDAAADCLEVGAGEQSDAIDVAGDFGGTPTATFEAPLEAEELQRTVVTEGDGESTEPGDQVSAQVTAFSGSTGEQLFSQPATLEAGSIPPAKDFKSQVLLLIQVGAALVNSAAGAKKKADLV